MKKIKVVWLCSVMNETVRTNVQFRSHKLDNIIRKLIGRPPFLVSDYAQWNTNALLAFREFDDVELHVITPVYGMRGNSQFFYSEGISYYCFRPQADNLFRMGLSRLLKVDTNEELLRERDIIGRYINEIQPDIIHIIGAEIFVTSMYALDASDKIPLLVSLQTLLSAPSFREGYFYSPTTYEKYVRREQAILKKAGYISGPLYHLQIIHDEINSQASFLKLGLGVGEDIHRTKEQKEYDFVYFALNIKKSFDDALEAFILASKMKPCITMNVIGDYSQDYKEYIDRRLGACDLTEYVSFCGKLPTHDDVLRQIRKSRFALLPLKVDLVSGTIREAMANGIPVITTITEGTPLLNEQRESVMLSPIGDYKAMADNMVKLMDSREKAEQLKENSYMTVKEKYNNKRIFEDRRKSYYQIIDNFQNGSMISKELLFNL